MSAGFVRHPVAFVMPDCRIAVARLVWNTGSEDQTDNGVILGSGFESLSGLLSFVKRNDPLAFFA